MSSNTPADLQFFIMFSFFKKTVVTLANLSSFRKFSVRTVLLNGTKYSRMDQVKFVEDRL